MARPKAFNPDDALEKAMHVFWHKGYEATSMEDLLRAMDIRRGSLYDTFGDKRQLFLKVIDRYWHSVLGPHRGILGLEGPALTVLRRFITTMTERALMDPQRRGCLIANTIMELAPHQRDIAGKLHRVLKLGEDAFCHLLIRAREQGEIGPDKDPRILAGVLITMMQGTVVMIKAGAPPETVRQTTKTALATLI